MLNNKAIKAVNPQVLPVSPAFSDTVLNELNKLVLIVDEQFRPRYWNHTFLRVMELSNLSNEQADLSQLAARAPKLMGVLSLLANWRERSRQALVNEDAQDSLQIGERWYHTTIRPFKAGGADETKYLLLVMSDITELWRLQQENRSLDQQVRLFVEQVKDYAIFMISTDFRATSWNLGVFQVLGYEEHEFIGQDVRHLIFTPEALANGTADAEFVTAADTGHASNDRWMLRKGSVRFWASGITTAIRGDDGEIVGYSKVMRDLTLRKHAEDELTALANQLTEEGRRKSEFLATLAHELRNPLAPIKNAVQLMSMYDLSDEMEELRATMARQAEQLVRLIDDLLDVSRISRGKISLKKSVVDLRTIIEAAVEASSALIKDNGQELILSMPEHALLVDADPARLAQVMSNLLNNAAKYSSAGARIRLTAEATEVNAVVCVEDEGIGIPPDSLNEIFDLFSQIGNGPERGTSGLGIGLTLVKTLVELHGGTVAAHSDGVDCGSRFTVTLPLFTGHPGELEVLGDAPVYAPVARYRVMVVEDLLPLSLVMERLLQKLGHEVRVVQSGGEALKLLEHWTPDVVFSDISMPGMSGYDLAGRIRSNPLTKDLYLVAMTGYGQSADRDKAILSGFDRHLVKPVDVQHLHSVFATIQHRDSTKTQ